MMERRITRSTVIRALLTLSVLAALLWSCVPKVNLPQSPPFAQLIAELSEEGGYFPSDNLVSNELGYQKVLNKLDELNLHGGVYIGVGPEQNFTYIAQIRPVRAFILDIRRDNLLQHLLFKALFIMARHRAEYLSLLLSRPLPREHRRWEQISIDELVEVMDGLPPDRLYYQANLRRVYELIAHRFRFDLTPDDQNRIDFIYSNFYRSGLDLRYQSHLRRSWRWFPTLRQLLVETDLYGRQRSFLASEEAFQFVKRLQERNLIIPVTGDFAGPKALRAIGDHVRRWGEQVSAFYTSNVEFYLLQQGRFSAFVENVKSLPRDEHSLIIRAYVGFGHRHPEALPGYFITTLLQRMDRFVQIYEAGEYRTYFDLGLLDYIRLRPARIP